MPQQISLLELADRIAIRQLVDWTETRPTAP